MITEWIISFFLILGALFMLLSSVGLLRFPDLYTRMHATTKASTMGMLLMFVAIVIYTPTLSVILKSLFIIIYVFITTPVASHMVGKAGHVMNIPKWENTHIDDLEEEVKGRSDLGTKGLRDEGT